MNYKYLFKNITRHIFVFIISATLLLVYSGAIAQPSNKVTGKVASATDGTGLPGLSIVIKGTTQGTVTDMDGNYTINVDDKNATLIFSFIGYTSTEVAINGRSVVDVTMEENIEALDEVVVTALGIKREEKSLGYSVGKVEGEELTRVVQENVLNSMAGKVSGVTINSTGGTGSSVSMVIRGATSLSSDNQPLFVVDGVPMSNTVNNVGGFGSDNRVDYGNAISDLNPEDIENVSILKGPSAAALYGTRAGNGVVLISTKKAKDKQGMKVSITSNTVFDIPARYLNVQSQFSTGFFSFTPEDVGGGVLPDINASDGTGAGPENDRGYWAIQWDAPLDANGNPIPTEVVSYPNNVQNFVNTGFTTTNGIAISNGNEIVNYRIGFTNMANNGIVPNSDLFRNNFSLSASSKAFDKLTISTSINIGNSWSNNRPASNRGANPLEWAYSTPANIDIRNLADYWVPGREGLEVRNVSSNHNNPYFLAYEVNNSFNRNRLYGNIVADYQILPSLNIMARYTLDKSDEVRETKMAPGYSKEPNNGAYGIRNSGRLERNIDILGTYRKDWDNFNLSVSAGGNILYAKSNYISNSSKSETGLIVANVFNVGNISSSALNYSSYLSQKSINSVYALANLGWKEILYLDLTARNDWSSTLPAENRSYFYPSVSLSVMANEIFDMGTNVNMLKLRGGWAQVGNDTDPYKLTSVYGNSGQWGDAIRLNKPGTLLSPNLKPEKATSLEFGADLKMFNNRLRFEGTYYTVDNRNQILDNIPIAGSSGFSNINLNAGLLQSRGVELLLGGTPVNTGNWRWDVNLNFTKNKTKIIELDDNVEFIEFWSDNKSNSIGYAANAETGKDGLVGNIYSSRIKRVTDENSPYYGYPLIGEGLDAEWLAEEEKVKVGNYNPDFIMGLQSQLNYKNFSLNMTLDWRSGGQYMSQTFRYFSESVTTQTWLDNLVNPGDLGPGQELRNWVIENADRLMLTEELRPIGGPTAAYGGFSESFSGVPVNDGTFAPGVVGEHDADGNFILDHENLGGDGTTFLPYVVSFPWDFGTPSMFDADYIKLREISLNYQLPNRISTKIGMQDVNFSIYSRNIILWTKDSDFGIDPERAFQAESSSGNRGTQFKQGIERYNVNPWVIPIGFKIGLTF
jgi:TonB-linked SusC/RagA family outer membrane protein